MRSCWQRFQENRGSFWKNIWILWIMLIFKKNKERIIRE